MPSLKASAAIVFAYVGWIALCGIPNESLLPVVQSLSTTAPIQDPVVLRSYILEDGARCREFNTPDVLPEDAMNEEEDEVAYFYPTNKRCFEVCASSSVTSSSTSPSISVVRQTSFGCGKLGGQIWESSVALCCYLAQHSLAEGKRVLELGSGIGLPSVVCRDTLKASAVLATDFWEMDGDPFDKERLVPTKHHGMNLAYNVVDRTGVVETSTRRLDWHDASTAVAAREEFRPDLIIGSDVVYYPMDVDPLLEVLEVLLPATRAVLVLPLAPAEREALPEFRSKLPPRFADTHTVKMEEMDLFREDPNGDDTKHLVIDMIPK